MNYRHSYHAGNFADVLKHVILARIVTYMKRKPQPFRVIDTHAGAGRYDLLGAAAEKTGEWRDGIGRLVDATPPPEIADLLAPYLDAVRNINEAGCRENALNFYPGSPLLAHYLMRGCDTLVANELHPEDGAFLKEELKGVRHAKVMSLDGWTAVKALLPPPERRGVVLIDPPFEESSEFKRLEVAIGQGLKRFAQGVFVIWYPVKDGGAADGFVSEVQQFAKPTVDVRLAVCKAFRGLGLTQTGVMVINPPYQLAGEMKTILPWLADRLAQDAGAGFRVEELG
jgi:23S rRNA (adenine2030-N6)-methyltransferase